MQFQDIMITRTEMFYGTEKIKVPFSLENLKSLWGEPRKEEIHYAGVVGTKIHYFWDAIGIEGIMNHNDKISSLRIHVKEHAKSKIENIFMGNILIEKTEYTKCKWKFDSEYSQTLKNGDFEIGTFLRKDLPNVDDSNRELAEFLSTNVEIYYVKPRKLVKYKFHPIDEPELTFSDFNFKLAVIQRLMYEKEVLLPKFDVEEFAEEYPKREIDTLEEGDEPIKEVVNWFKKLQIPVSLADEVDEIHMDGGNDIYLQIIPYWDGEDDYFDLKKVTSEDLAQFKNLKKMTVMSRKYKQIAKVLEENGIEAKPL